jgi:peptidyl-prolyl cis-trans isomerase D
MAVIQKLRNSGWVAVVIIVTLVLFVAGDWLTGRGNNGNTDENRDVIGEISGELVREAELGPIVEELYKKELDQDPNFKLDEEAANRLNQKAWQELVKRKVLIAAIEKSGVEVTDEDFNEMMVGAHPEASILGDASFQTDGKFDPKKVEQLFRQAKSNPQQKVRLAMLVDQMKKTELETRYAMYVGKSQMFRTKKELEFEYLGSMQTNTGKIVALNFSNIQDKDVKVTDEDLEDYLNDHKERYKIKSEARDFKYVVFDITPSSEDTMAAIEQANNYVKTLKSQSTPDTLGASPFIRRSDLTENTPKVVVDSLWSAALGTVVGPSFKDGKFTIYQKVASKKDTVPVVNVSHILIPLSGDLPNGTKIVDSIQALSVAQDVYNQVTGGKAIADLAGLYSADPGSANKGGTYGWQDPRQTVAGYKKFCLTAKKGQVELVKTEYGYHIMKMMDDPDYTNIRYVVNEVEIAPGSKTVNTVVEKSRKFKNQVNPEKPETFEKAAEMQAMAPLVAKDFTTDQKGVARIEQISEMRTIMYWLFDDKREKGDVSEIFTMEDKHVIVKMEAVKRRGYATVDMVRAELEPLVREKKKGELANEKLAKAMASAKTAEALQKAVNGDIMDCSSVRYGEGSVGQFGQEFRILGALFGLADNTTSKPIAGKQMSAVIFKEKLQKMEIPVSVYNAPNDDSYLNQPNYVLSRLQDMMLRYAYVQDYRYKFEWYK